MNTIKIQIEDEKDLFSTINPDEDSFTDEVKAYILRCLEKTDFDQEINIRFYAARPINEERIKKVTDAWIKEVKEELHEKNRENTLHQLKMFAIGVAFISLSLFLQPKVHLVWFTIMSTIGSLSIWEAANIWIIENPKMLKNKRILEKLEKNISISVESGK